jgi:spore maturation protein CgeB
LVTSNVGSSLDLVIEGSTGAIAMPNPTSLALACLRILSICRDPVTFQRCRAQVEHYSVRVAAEGIARAYGQLKPENALVADPVVLDDKPRIALLGEFHGTNLAGSIQYELLGMGIAPIFFRSQDAFTDSVAQKLFYRFNRRPMKLNAFAHDLAQTCIDAKVNLLITTGICPLTEHAAARMVAKGIVIVNWMSDDPWNKAYKNNYLIPTLKYMSTVFSPRQANIEQLKASGPSQVVYLPFASDKRFFSPKPYKTLADIEGDIELLFVGGADAERRKTLLSVAKSDLKIALYGGYWGRAAIYRKFIRGIATPEKINIETQQAKVSLILVRRANRDGHVMRSLEAAASGACLLVEHTREHEALFGADGDCVQYFYANAEILPKTNALLANPTERHRLRQNIIEKMRTADHSYGARVRDILRIALPKLPLT